MLRQTPKSVLSELDASRLQESCPGLNGWFIAHWLSMATCTSLGLRHLLGVVWKQIEGDVEIAFPSMPEDACPGHAILTP